MSEIYNEKALKTQSLILEAAEEEFALKGLYGARVDEIARQSKVNKRMIYRYFVNKEELYKKVLYESYKKMAKAEEEIFGDYKTSEEAIKKIIRLYFLYLNNNPNYVSLILWENLNKGEYIKNLDFSNIKNKVFEYMLKVLREGKKNAEFRNDFDEEQVILSILTFTFSYFSNKYTLNKLLKDTIDFKDDLNKRIENVTQMILKYIKMEEH